MQEGDSWWGQSGHAVPDPALFFLPTRIVSPFGHQTTVTYDAFAQHVVSVVDPLGNTVTAEVDYRVLSPRSVTDPRGASVRRAGAGDRVRDLRARRGGRHVGRPDRDVRGRSLGVRT